MKPARSTSTPTSRRTFLAASISAPIVATWATPAVANSPTTAPTTEAAARPVTLPAVQRFGAGHRAKPLTPATRLVLAEDSPELMQTATLLAQELVSEGHLSHVPQVVRGGRSRPLDIVLQLGPVAGTTSEEAYEITTDRRDGLVLTAPTGDGVFWATRTLLQLLREGRPAGHIIDWPDLRERALMVDIGRKYFSPDWLKTLIREMSYLKMNTLQLHLSDGLGFRVECESHPEIVSEQHLSKDEVRDLIEFARRYHVRINADVDTPGHMEHILQHYPELQLVLAGGTRLRSHLDFSKPQARQLVQEIIAEMCELFEGPVFHLGGDEYFPAPWQGTGPDVVSDATAPQLVDYARAVTGEQSATAHDGYEHYLNELADLVRSRGKTARIFNDDVYPGEGVSRVDERTEVDVWIRWNRSKPNAGDFVRAGHSVINANGDYLYFILTSEGLGQGPYKNPKGIYERWTPRTFMGAAGSQGDYLLPEDMPMLGSHLSVWCDSPDAMTQAEVAELLQEWLQVFAQQTWGSEKLVPTLRELRADVLPQVGTAPGTDL